MEKLENLREYLNKLVESDCTCLSEGEILAVSQSLDQLINDCIALEASSC